MPLVPAALLVIALAGLAYFTWRDVRQYAAFKRLTDTKDRQARYRRWLVGAFAVFIGGSLAILAMLGCLGCMVHPPKPFLGAMRWAQARLPPQLVPLLLGGLVSILVMVVVAGVVMATSAARRRATPKLRTIGDIAPLMPRNGAETVWTALLSLNAGFGEELFFRLTLPLLFALVTGSAAAAFVAAAVVFGLMHVYQGWAGVAAASFLGLVLTAIYLWTGSLALPIALHAGLDLVGLVVRPTLARMAERR